MAPSSSFALSLKPSIWYLALNFPAFWKKQMTSPPLAYAGIPYQVFGARTGAAALIRAWSLLAMARSGSCIFAIAASASASPSDLAASAFISRTRSRIAAFSSALKPWEALVFVLARFAGVGLALAAGFVGAMVRAPGRELVEATSILWSRPTGGRHRRPARPGYGGDAGPASASRWGCSSLRGRTP